MALPSLTGCLASSTHRVRAAGRERKGREGGKEGEEREKGEGREGGRGKREGVETWHPQVLLAVRLLLPTGGDLEGEREGG